MRLKLFIELAASTLATTLVSPLFAQGAPSPDTTRPENSVPATEPPPPPSGTGDPAPREAQPPPDDVRPSPPMRTEAPATGPVATTIQPSDTEIPDETKMKVGSVLSPLVITTGLGYAYASVNHPEISDHGLSGAFVEITAGTELDRRFRLSLAFTNFETKLRRSGPGKWEEGDYSPRVASSGLRPVADPGGDRADQAGGLEVQKIFHANSIGPRMDFLPLGSQGPYLGMTAAVAIIQDVSARVGANLAARVGGEWRPFQSFALAIEAGAHGQIYTDAKAAIPYALARMTLLLEPARLRGATPGSAPVPTNIYMPRTLPSSVPR
jgi:hypothetical protein